ncbi:hypothetical protein [Pseudarthrobacter defluvii]|uniref:hypothetical protein n=1 Tax=Pseudarthrobacter defluvii TaxID=410837 RepID=UPI0027D8487F|nr:hypothetical protein [Pseudarthrobacter defluvii]
MPLGMLVKGAKQRLDAKHDGKGVAVLGRVDNSRLAIKMLHDAARNLPRLSSANEPDDGTVFAAVVESDAADSSTKVDAYEDWKASSLDSRNFTESHKRRLLLLDMLVARLAKNYLFLVELDADLVGTRTTLKYSLDEDLPELEDRGPQQIRFKLSIPDYGFAASQHVEFEVPKGLCIQSIDFVAFDRKLLAIQSSGHSVTSPTRTAHEVLAPKSVFHTADAWVAAAPARQGVFSFSKWAAVITTFIVLATIPVRIWNNEVLRPEALIPSPAASIILVTPALLLSWMSKEPEHELVARLLAPLRGILLASGGILLTMAVLAAVPVSPWIWWGSWFIIYGATAWMAIHASIVFSSYKKVVGPDYSSSIEGRLK